MIPIPFSFARGTTMSRKLLYEGSAGFTGSRNRVKIKHVDASQEYSGIVMAGNPDESCQADSFSLDECLDSAVRAEYRFDVAFRANVVNLPQIQMIRFHVHQGLGEMSQSAFLIAGVRTARKKYLIAPFSQCPAVVRLTPGVCPPHRNN